MTIILSEICIVGSYMCNLLSQNIAQVLLHVATWLSRIKAVLQERKWHMLGCFSLSSVALSSGSYQFFSVRCSKWEGLGGEITCGQLCNCFV